MTGSGGAVSVLNFTGAASNTFGAVYYQNGTPAGIVYQINDGNPGTGRVVGLKQPETRLSWGPTGANNASNQTDGLANMAVIKTLDDDFSDYPAFAWVDALNGPAGMTTYTTGATGIWYLPARNEIGNYTGGVLQAFINYGRDNFNAVISTAGGAPLRQDMHWTSCSQSNDCSWYAHLGANDFGVSYMPKSEVHYVIAICRF